MAIEYYNENDVWGKIYVSPNGIMSGKFNIIAVEDSELISHFHVRAYEEYDVNATILPRVIARSDKNSYFDVKYKDESGILSTIQAYENNFIDSFVFIRPFGSMMGIFDIIEPPKITENLIAIQDSTVRSKDENRYINYGKFSTMMVGVNNDGEYLGSYIKFPLNNYPETLTVLKSTLRLYYSATLEEGIIELYNLSKDWDEYGVTYANRPLLTDLITGDYTINKASKYIEFDVLDYVQDVVSKKKDNVGFGITANNLNSYTLFTRESSLKPTLTITYFDTRIFNVGRGDLSSTIFAYGLGSSDLHSFLSVKQTFNYDELGGTIHIHRYDDFLDYDIEATLMVSTPDLHSNILVVQNDDSNLKSMLTVRRENIEDTLSLINVSVPDLYGTFHTRHYDDFKGTLTARAFKEEDVNAFIGISRESIQGHIYVMPTNDLYSYFTIQQETIVEISSMLSVNKPDLHSTFMVKYRSDLDSYITIYQNIDDDIISTLNVNKPDLYGSLYIKDRSDLNSNITIRALEEVDVLGYINISKPDIYGTLLVAEYNDLYSTIVIKQSDEDDVSSLLNVSKPELYSTVIAKVQNLADGFLNVSNPDLNMIMITRAYKEEDVDATLLPRIIGVADLRCTIDGLNKYRSGAYWYII